MKRVSDRIDGPSFCGCDWNHTAYTMLPGIGKTLVKEAGGPSQEPLADVEFVDLDHSVRMIDAADLFHPPRLV
jgi:hypothetical protein